MRSPRFVRLVPLLALILPSCISHRPHSNGGLPILDQHVTISAWVVYWDVAKSVESVENNSTVLDEINPFYYAFDDKAQIIENSPGIETIPALASIINSGRFRIIPTIVNDRIYPSNAKKLKDDDIIRYILDDPGRMEDHVESICQLVEAQPYDGIDIDYEKLHPSDSHLFTQFILMLGGRLHAKGKLLTVTVQQRTSAAQEKMPGALDWSALGAVADRVRIMCYNYSYPGSDPGPVAPPEWISQIIKYARSRIPDSKISLALALHGFDWSESTVRSLTFEQAMAIAQKHQADVRWDAGSSTPYFIYYHQGRKHEVWFENAQSLEAKLQVILDNDIKSISLWRLGGEDREIFPALTEYKKLRKAGIRSDISH